ncbi:hypothetical protein FA95DRAFT_1485177 [Auriscalpium vulgare]|uniref:Uncharacterized protein n=1 Tax=Auriscalpium vulgare TaxID=40419 RepID=A0ACB8S541_9AGAM|nr:hypothetical protein FA95DRAFT_1485177 [Auriscalpium vulgare]
MGEVVNVIVAFAVIVFIVRWATSPGNDSPEEQAVARALRFKPKKVTPEMTQTVAGMFPHIPQENIHYDLLRTGSVEITTNKILEKGFLDPPSPAYFTLYPRTAAAPNPAGERPAAAARPAAPAHTLISRFRLEERVDSVPAAELEDIGGRATWEDTAEKREASLRERKAKMVLAARQ